MVGSSSASRNSTSTNLWKRTQSHVFVRLGKYLHLVSRVQKKEIAVLGHLILSLLRSCVIILLCKWFNDDWIVIFCILSTGRTGLRKFCLFICYTVCLGVCSLLFVDRSGNLRLHCLYCFLAIFLLRGYWWCSCGLWVVLFAFVLCYGRLLHFLLFSFTPFLVFYGNIIEFDGVLIPAQLL